MPERTPLYDAHLKHHAKIVDFHGFLMPLHYGSQIEEHHAVRQHVGIFDVSHMGIVDIKGERSLEFIRKLLANDIKKIPFGRAMYSCMLNEKGGVIDDLIAYRIHDQHIRLIINSACVDKDLAWMNHQNQESILIQPLSNYVLLALQGREVASKIPVLFPDISEKILALKPFSFLEQADFFIARTGYTGEAGFEISMPVDAGKLFFEKAIEAGVRPCGLGSRDTLRLESGFNLFGQDMDESVTPYESNLAWTIDLTDTDRLFTGRIALEKQLSEGVLSELTGLLATEPCVLRSGYSVMQDGVEIGKITSGTFSPTLNQSIALARIQKPLPQSAKVAIRGKLISVKLVTPRFYHAKK